MDFQLLLLYLILRYFVNTKSKHHQRWRLKEPLKAVSLTYSYRLNCSCNSSCRISSFSCSRIYFRITSSSSPTVETKYPPAHICCPVKYLCRSPYRRALYTALFPFMCLSPVQQNISAISRLIYVCGRLTYVLLKSCSLFVLSNDVIQNRLKVFFNIRFHFQKDDE